METETKTEIVMELKCDYCHTKLMEGIVVINKGKTAAECCASCLKSRHAVSFAKKIQGMGK